MTDDELKEVIRCVHKLWYDEEWTKSPAAGLRLHRHMEVLFNYAGITSTLVANNPEEVSPIDFKIHFGIDVEKIFEKEERE